MKFLLPILVSVFSFNLFAAAGEITGVVNVAKDAEKAITPNGVLFIIAKKAGSAAAGSAPLAVLRIPEPKFPQKFTIGASNLMMGGKFEGPMSLTARFTATGDAMDKTGPEGTPEKSSIDPGAKDVKIELKSKKK